MDSWLRSCRNHFEVPFPDKTAKGLRLDLYDTVYFEKKKFKEAYTKHLKKVLNYFKGRERDLLVIDICGGEGWEKLCPFFNKSIPNQVFPKLGIRNKKRIGTNSKIDKNIGLLGIFLKNRCPKLYFKLKKIKEKKIAK